MTSANPPQHARTRALARGWPAFRRWRRTRPFRGGLFLLLAGLEIFQSTQASLGGLTFHLGPTGYLSWLIPTVLAACGLLMWFTPQQRMFYGIIGAMTAVFSLIAVNLGGFLIGMLLGMVGGALGFAWTPAAPVQPAKGEGRARPRENDSAEPPVAGGTADEPMTGLLTDALPQPRNPLLGQVEPAGPRSGSTEQGVTDSAGALPGAPTASTEQSGHESSRHSPPAFVMMLIMLTAAATGAVTLSGQAAHADACPSPIMPTASAPTASATPAASPGAVPEGAGSAPAMDWMTKAESTPTAGSTEPAPTPTTGSTKRLAAAGDQSAVAERPSRLTGSNLTMTGLKLEGLTDLPTVDGTLRVLKFSMGKAVTRDFELQISGGGGTSMVIKSSALTVDGDVDFYATRFAGRVLGVEVVLTPESPVPPDGIDLTAPVIAVDDPDVQLVYVNCDTLIAPNLNESFI